ncbi:hypothetical protein [Paraburkholderia bryophila]|uniref:Uncharacterized protein n=1 Tax=Paraburkholderia bryophila TaxID=420952 RepID=A0A7Z0B0F3_9BURK|nr:hypothetical protein [Paraburkholderia bryophila]NYH15307.1 hypothetical protein [Paraburkholderia bryophila]
MASLQERLDRAPGSSNSYFRAKAQCWLDAAQQARQAHDQWGFVEEAIGQAATITIGVERGTPLSAANPALRTVSTVRPDLWAIVNAIKADPAVAQCPQAQLPLACAEVELMQAGHDAWIRSFASAEKRLPEVKDKLRKSAETAVQCKQGHVGIGTCTCLGVAGKSTANHYAAHGFAVPFQRRLDIAAWTAPTRRCGERS